MLLGFCFDFGNNDQFGRNAILKPFTAKDEISRSENLTNLWSWILRGVTRIAAIHTSLCNTLLSNKHSENPGS